MMEQPSLSSTYTSEKFSVFGLYAYGNSDWNTPFQNDLKYPLVNK